MTEKKLYALTDEQVETLVGSADNWSRTLRMNNRESMQEDHAIAALIPLDTDAVVERMARGLSEHWRDMHTNEALGQQRMLARAALGALLGGERS